MIWKKKSVVEVENNRAQRKVLKGRWSELIFLQPHGIVQKSIKATIVKYNFFSLECSLAVLKRWCGSVVWCGIFFYLVQRYFVVNKLNCCLSSTISKQAMFWLSWLSKFFWSQANSSQKPIFTNLIYFLNDTWD